MYGVAIGDCHYDKMRKYWDNHATLVSNEAATVMESAVSRGFQYCVFLGDIGEGIRDATGQYRLSEESQVSFFDLIDRYRSQLEIHIISGNHDFTSVGHNTLSMVQRAFRGVSGVNVHLQPQTVRLGKHRVDMLPFPHRERLHSKSIAGFAHYEVAGALHDSGRVIQEGEAPSYDNYQFVQGHLHTKQQVGIHYYPGTLYQTSFGERPEKYFLEFRLGAEFKSRFIRHRPKMVLENLTVETSRQLKTLSPNPLHLYKLCILEGVKYDTLPSNVVHVSGARNLKEALEVQNLERELEFSHTSIDYTSALETYFSTVDAKPRIKKRALEIMENYKDGKALT